MPLGDRIYPVILITAGVLRAFFPVATCGTEYPTRNPQVLNWPWQGCAEVGATHFPVVPLTALQSAILVVVGAWWIWLNYKTTHPTL
jgi:hypothetical protein